ncbi:unnamed protein product [Clonostachys rosea f. rosea IK726]|uniref:Uncharacterized protein n=1 Tax=Clonostachys rosea f. rosea IK726 TaxID=1349383 RepID=A0ACA9TPB1_BIOOC|nr:unnamed protein product [Clonostachys rosea f. rosea IK726]
MTSVASTFLSRVRTTSGTTGRAVEEAIQGFKHVLKGSGLETEIQELEKEDKIPPVDAVLEQISMTSSEAKSDLGLYAESMILERCEKGMLATGDQALLEEMQHILTEHAEGMFLWVTFLLDDLCAQYCDDDIRKCLKTLPKNLKDTFNRVLSRIVAHNRDGLVKKVIHWLVVASRPLTLDELCDALSIEVGQKHAERGRRVNDKGRIFLWCENLVHIDEEDESVQFAHHTIFQFITEGCSDLKFADFHVRLEEADHLAGERCLTYLHYGDFQKAVARRQQTRLLQPRSIGLVAIGSHGKRSKLPGS